MGKNDKEHVPVEALARARDKVERFVATYVRKGPYELYPSVEVVENVKDGLARNLALHGKMYCPCVPVERAKTMDTNMVCPCTPHAADIERQGYCDCALFAAPGYTLEP